MKRTFILSFVLAFILGTTAMSASDTDQNDWKQKMMCEKIAFLTMEMGITPEEAQEFWPVYNQVNKERDAAMHKVFKSFKALEDAVSAGKSEKELDKLLENYLDAIKEQGEVEKDAYDDYAKVLPVEKLAKLYVGEEKFRRQHIRKLHGGGGRPGPKN